jgi:hypothetical protein
MTPLQTLQTEARAEYPKHCENSYCQWRTITLDELDSLTRRAYLLGVEECEKAMPLSFNGVKLLSFEKGYNAYHTEALEAIHKIRDERV